MMKWRLRLFFCFWLASMPLCFLFASMPNVPGVPEEGLSPEEQRRLDEVVKEELQNVKDMNIPGLLEGMRADDMRRSTDEYRTLQERLKWNGTILFGNRESRIAVYNGDLIWLGSQALRWGAEAAYLQFLVKSRIEFITEQIITHREELMLILDELRRFDAFAGRAALVADATPLSHDDSSGASSKTSGDLSGHSETSSKDISSEEEATASTNKKKKPSRSWFGRFKHWLFGVDLPPDPREKIVSRLFGHLKQYHSFSPLQFRYIVPLLLNATFQNGVLALEKKYNPTSIDGYAAEHQRFEDIVTGRREACREPEDDLHLLMKPWIAYESRWNPDANQYERVMLRRMPPVSMRHFVSIFSGTTVPCGYDFNTDENLDEPSLGDILRASFFGLPKFLYSAEMNRAIRLTSMLLLPLFFERWCRNSWQEVVAKEWEPLMHILEEYDGSVGSEIILEEKIRAFVTKGHNFASPKKAVSWLNWIKLQPRWYLEALRSLPLASAVAYKLCNHLPRFWEG